MSTAIDKFHFYSFCGPVTVLSPNMSEAWVPSSALQKLKRKACLFKQYMVLPDGHTSLVEKQVKFQTPNVRQKGCGFLGTLSIQQDIGVKDHAE